MNAEAGESTEGQARAPKRPAPQRPAKKKSMSGTPARTELPPAFERVVSALSGERHVTFGGRGFGASALKFDGKLFAPWSARGEFVVKLPKQRVAELVTARKGKYFDTGAGRLMKEWLALTDAPTTWTGLAREALAFVGAASSRRTVR